MLESTTEKPMILKEPFAVPVIKAKDCWATNHGSDHMPLNENYHHNQLVGLHRHGDFGASSWANFQRRVRHRRARIGAADREKKSLDETTT